MHEHTSSGGAVSFVAMWIVMMVPMMLPAVAPTLWRYRQAVATAGETRPGGLTALVGMGYIFVWTAIGMAAHTAGLALTAIGMRLPELAEAVPIAAGAVIVMAGVVQFTAWKARQLACCRETSALARVGFRPSFGEAWRHGLRLGLDCVRCCGNLMAILLVFGVMDLRAMAVVTAAIAGERLAPAGERVARATGTVAVGAGLFAIARAAWLG